MPKKTNSINFEKMMDERNYSVVKSNALIQKSRFNLSLQEQKIILRLIQMIKPDDTDLKLYNFSIKEFCELCGIDNSNGKNYVNIKKTLEKLMDKKVWVVDDNGTEFPLRWILKPYLNKGSGVVKIKLDEDMKPYLLQLKNYFTKYNLYYTLAMKSQYSIRVYELLKSYQNLGSKEFKIVDLKKQLGAEKYLQWNDFKRNVLTPSVLEINELTDLKVSYELIKNGRQWEIIIFFIQFKKDFEERLEAWIEIENRLNPKQIKGQISLLTNFINGGDSNEND